MVFVLGGMAVAAPAHAQTGSAQAELNTEMRLSRMEDEMRQLNGRIEELSNSVAQLKEQLERVSSDVDQRFSQLQAPPPASAATAPPPASAAGAPPPPPPPPSPGTLGTLVEPSPGRRTAAAATVAGAATGSSEDQYNYAMGLLTQANYPAAEQAMRDFVQHFPKDPLAGNAQYWLGETFYVRKDYASAATAFAQGYEKYPKGAKASDDLLKLGMSLANLNQKQDACRAYARLERDFPNEPPTVKERIATEKKRAGC